MNKSGERERALLHLPNQIFIPEPLPNHSQHQSAHLVNGAQDQNIVTVLEFSHVTVSVLLAGVLVLPLGPPR